ncbi:cupin domain-containing protein [Paenibacillus sp. 1P07SE]|uniref:cupin domain-containing protein n=1 Tax=Paenibacillus sp. 1P07SE TaxID=3132209 RepID=UPI0039A52041
MSESPYLSTLKHGQPLSPLNSNLIIAEWTAPGTSEGDFPEHIAPLHKHHQDDEAWYVLEGSLGFQIGDEVIEAGAGQAVIVPRGMPHTYWNPKPIQARYLIMMTARIHSLIEAIHREERRDPETMVNLFQSFDSELI